jgi:hypothetical protein
MALQGEAWLMSYFAIFIIDNADDPRKCIIIVVEYWYLTLLHLVLF